MNKFLAGDCSRRFFIPKPSKNPKKFKISNTLLTNMCYNNPIIEIFCLIWQFEVLILKKIAGFIVDKHKFILAVMLVICAFCAALIPKVEINTDMTKYLPDDSSMSQGIDIMANEFDNLSTSQTIRVMFKDLTAQEINLFRQQLENIQYVDSVAYVEDSEDYNKDGYTKFTVSTSYSYGSPEELAIEETIEKQFAAYDVEYMNDNSSTMDLPWLMIAVAIVILLIILFVMSGSWFEPILFMATIGIAVVINMGSNLALGSVSQITMSIAAILQLVLSMDYSIILANRYRQEKEHYDDAEDAMKAAWKNAFSSITSSGMTTVIGLIVLVFMSFKIGMDLGLVLAKGVLLSMICVLTVLPALLLIFDEKIEDTAKKEIHIPMGLLAKGQFKLRRVIAIFFVVLFAGSYILQGYTQISYAISPEDPIAEVFAPSNPIVVLYNNADEDRIANLTVELEENENVNSVMSYSTTLGQEFTSQGMVDMIDSMGVAMSIDSSLLDIIYYSYYSGDKLLTMTVPQLFNFISNEIIPNPMFSDFISDDMKNSLDEMKMFADADALTTPKTVEELADVFGMNADDLKKVFVLYYSKYTGADYGTMTMPVFADFVVNEVAKNPQYSAMFDDETKSQLSMLVTFTDKETVLEKRDYMNMASALGYSTDDILLLYAYHSEYLENPEAVNYEDVIAKYVAWQMMEPAHYMSIYELVNFVADNKDTFGSMMEAEQLSQIEMGKKVISATVKETPLTPEQLASITGMPASQLRQLYLLYISEHGDTSNWKMSVQRFAHFVESDVLPNKDYAGYFDAETTSQLTGAIPVIDAVASGKAYSAAEISSLLAGVTDQLDSNTIEMLYLYYTSTKESNPEWTLTIQEMFRYLSEDMVNDPKFAAFLGDDLRSEIDSMKSQLDEGISQLLGENHSLMMIETSLPVESEETTLFMDSLTELCDAKLENRVYFIGNTPMNYEMAQSFDRELLLITVLTAVSIFVVVLITFRSIWVPLILVLLVQCGVYITMSVNCLMGYSIFYLALLVVQCILMGATIDYGILFTNYYRENRKTMDIHEALVAAYNGSIHTILTSGLIIVVVTGVIGFSPVDPTIAQICQTISIGSLSAILLILFVLPGLLAAFDKLIVRKKKEKTK